MRYDIRCKRYERDGTVQIDEYVVVASNQFAWCKLKNMILRSIGPFDKYSHPSIECTRVRKTNEPPQTFEIKKVEKEF